MVSATLKTLITTASEHKVDAEHCCRCLSTALDYWLMNDRGTTEDYVYDTTAKLWKKDAGSTLEINKYNLYDRVIDDAELFGQIEQCITDKEAEITTEEAGANDFATVVTLRNEKDKLVSLRNYISLDPATVDKIVSYLSMMKYE